MEIQIKDSIRTEEYPASDQMVKKIKEAHGGIYVTAEDAPQFVALRIEDFDQLLQQQKRLMLREQYILDQIEAGLSLKELQALLLRLDQLDQAWLTNPEKIHTDLLEQTQEGFRQYGVEQGVNTELLDDEGIDAMITNLVRRTREEVHSA